MAHFAKIEQGTVCQVIVVANEALDPNNEEASGQAVLAESGLTGEYVQCSYNGGPIGGAHRGPYPSIGWRWDGETFSPPMTQNDL